MRRLTASAIAFVLVLAIVGPASAGHGAGRGYMPANAKVHGHTLSEIGGMWTEWGFNSPADVNPLVANRCEQSPTDKKMWFLPVSLGGDYAVGCDVPDGAFIVLFAGGYECSEAEGNGSTEAELTTCAAAGFDLLTLIQVSLDGKPAKHLDRYVVTTPLVELPGPNLFGVDPTPSVTKGYFLILRPMKHGAHTLRAYDEFASIPFTAGITYNITVGKPNRHHD